MLKISSNILQEIQVHGEAAYPNEGAGLLLGRVQGDSKLVTAILTLENAREQTAQHNRYLLTPQDYLYGEQVAARRGLDVLGIFHSHPDHPNRPSDYDRQWAMPWFSYIITSINAGKAAGSRSWLLNEDRSAFSEESIQEDEI